MSLDQILFFAVLAVTISLFLWDKWRYDLVALGALLACVILGLVPAEQAFEGFGHPAVITVAAVLILSFGLQTTGAVDSMAQRILPSGGGPVLGIAALMGLGAFLSAFMNNVGAMALLMPIAIQLANKQNIPPGKVLMPLAFGTIFGGMTTLIGTPPNLIVAGFRAESAQAPFSMFDFTPVGIAVALSGILFTVVFGRWLVPTRSRSDAGSFDTGTYITEVRIGEDSKVAGQRLGEVEDRLDDDTQIVGLVHNDFRVTAPRAAQRLQAGDILVLESEPESLGPALTRLGLKLEEDVPSETVEEEDAESSGEADKNAADGDEVEDYFEEATTTKGKKEENNEDSERSGSSQADEITVQELLVQPTSLLSGRSASDMRIRSRYAINLLAISRQGHRSIRRLRWTELQPGDVLLMQGTPDAISHFSSDMGCIPLAPRSILIPDAKKAYTALGIMFAAVLLAALGILPTAIAFVLGVVGYMLTRVIPMRRIYEAVDWPIIVLLGALMPLADAMAETGAADLLAMSLLDQLAQGDPVIALALMLVVTLILSSFMNNAATAAIMCPIAIGIAHQLEVNPDSFLMAVAIGASCAFLTPIGHQNNTLILGPGGFRFGDYWPLGLPLAILVVAVSVPMLLWVWPL